MRTRVFITIDTEFSIAGAFTDPVQNRPVGLPAVLCEVEGKSHGLEFLLDTFARFGITTTFFVEALNISYFGDEPMREIALRIRAAGHDLQLHLHPCWTYFQDPEWRDRLKVDPPTDHMHGRQVSQLKKWLAEGIATFERWGLDRPVALRTGSMMADRAVYQAMEELDIRIGSNLAVALYRPVDPALHFYSGFHCVGGVVEACVLTYSDFTLGARRHYKSLTVTGSSWSEMHSLLERAQASNVESVVILTHAFEYVKYHRSDFTGLLPNRINQGRLARLCEFLGRNRDRFEVATIGGLASGRAAPSPTNVLLTVPPQYAVARIVENRLNSMIGGL